MELYLELFLQAIEGVPKIKDGYNPATWMLDVTTPSMESQMSLDFAQIFSNSSLYRYAKENAATKPECYSVLLIRT